MDQELRRKVAEIVERARAATGVIYQSIYHQGAELVRGERTDLLERHALIRPEDLEGRTVLDLGCNTGAASFLAHESGAVVEGWDRRPLLVTAATELAELFGYAVTFRVADYALPEAQPAGYWDTGFAFAVTRHGDPRPSMARCRVVYLETNARDHNQLPVEAVRGWRSEFLGTTARGRRSFYRLDRGA